jgi:hypothetical protein
MIDGGKWKVVDGIVQEGYDAILVWECAPDVAEGRYCHCDSTLSTDVLLDNPTCTGYVRRLTVGVTISDTAEMALLAPIEANFDTDGIVTLRRNYIFKLEQ